MIEAHQKLEKVTKISLQDNGQVDVSQSLPLGIVILPVHEAMQRTEWCHFISTELKKDQSGIFIYVAPGIQLAEPLFVTDCFVDDDTSISHYCLISQDSRAQIIWSNQRSVAKVNMSVFLRQGASLELTSVQDQKAKQSMVHELIVTQDQESQFNYCALHAALGHLKEYVTVHLEGQRAECSLTALMLGADQSQQTCFGTVNHLASMTKSYLHYRGMGADQAQVSAHAKVKVNKECRHIHAEQALHHLALSKTAKMDVQPILEIDCQDVSCRHGATVGQLEEEALFYLTSRGVSSKDAKQLLVRAFAENVDWLFSSVNLKNWFHNLYMEKLDTLIGDQI